MLSAFQSFLVAAYLFFFGSVGGWALELLFRRFISGANPQRKWLNPGFLVGPCLPLYGVGTVVLYLLTILQKWLMQALSGGILFYVIMFLIMALAMTLIEYIAGLIFIKALHVKLWDYTDQWGNIQGIICPKFTLLWGIMAVAYDFLLFPPLNRLVEWFILHPLSSFAVGMCMGIFLIDCAFSLHLGTLLRKKAKELDHIIDLQAYQRESQRIGRFFNLPKFRPVSEKIDKFELFLHRSPAAVAQQGAPSDDVSADRSKKK